VVQFEKGGDDATLEPRRGLCHIGPMGDLSTYRVIVRARDNGTGYTYQIVCTDDPAWSQGTNVFYPSPETAGEAGRVALKSLLGTSNNRRSWQSRTSLG
jgi:hypothetical protein